MRRPVTFFIGLTVLLLSACSRDMEVDNSHVYTLKGEAAMINPEISREYPLISGTAYVIVRIGGPQGTYLYGPTALVASVSTDQTFKLKSYSSKLSDVVYNTQSGVKSFTSNADTYTFKKP